MSCLPKRFRHLLQGSEHLQSRGQAAEPTPNLCLVVIASPGVARLKCHGKYQLHRPFQRGRGGSAPRRAPAYQGQGVQRGEGSQVPHCWGPRDLQAAACDVVQAFAKASGCSCLCLSQSLVLAHQLGGVWATSASPTLVGTEPWSSEVPCGEEGGEAPGCELPGTLHVSVPGEVPWVGRTPARSFPSVASGHPPEHPQLQSSEWFGSVGELTSGACRLPARC